jgi:hypothetical protein
MSLNVINNFLSEEDIDYILTLSEVIEAKKCVDSKNNGSVYFSISLTESMKQIIFNNFGFKIDRVPMRWIKGDTQPHIDIGSKNFKKTHLLYLTDNSGKFLVENKKYPIVKGNAFIFNEGLRHETIDTGLEPRLLLGPMSEQGLAVGNPGITISGDGGTYIYFRQNGSDIQYSQDEINWITINLLSQNPISILNNTPSAGAGMLTVKFVTNITVSSINFFFICLSNYIQFGSKTLNDDGTRPQITIEGVTGYSGLIQNYSSPEAFSYISILNLEVLSVSSILDTNAGWLCHNNFGSLATNNYIINCYSNGGISGDYSGGIVGSAAVLGGGNLTIIGCSSIGSATGDSSGGIIGQDAGLDGGTVTIQSCWSTGAIAGSGAGGIVGGNSYNIIVTNCYSTGVISGDNAGGIVGANPGSDSTTSTITNCYSFGNISNTNSGGICGSLSSNTGVTINNCYSIGNVSEGVFAGAICGNNAGGSAIINYCYAVGIVSNYGYIIGGNFSIPPTCYSESGSAGGNGGVWSDEHAKTVLTGYPITGYIGTTWVTGIDSPYLLFNEGYTPYSSTNISGTNLIRTSSASINVGKSSNSGIKTSNYVIIQKSGGNSGSYSSININQVNGTISTTSSTVPGVYTLYIANIDNISSFPYINYNIITFTLTVKSPEPDNNGGTPYLPIKQSVSFNQKSSFCGTRAVSSTAVGIGSIRGKGSSTRIFNNCKGNNSANFNLCQLRVLGYK